MASTVGEAAVPGPWIWSVVFASLPASVTHDVVGKLSIGMIQFSVQVSKK